MEKKQLLLISGNTELSRFLEKGGKPFYSVISMECIHAGFATALNNLPDIILVDYSSLGLESLKNLSNFRSNHFLRKSFLFLLADRENKKVLEENFAKAVDGIIYDQVPESKILEEVGQRIKNRKVIANYWKDSFMGLFNILGNPVLLLENDRIIAMNDAFRRDFYISGNPQMKLTDLVEEKNKAGIQETLRKFKSGKYLKTTTASELLMNDKLREAKISFSKLNQKSSSQILMMICFRGNEIRLNQTSGKEMKVGNSASSSSLEMVETFTRREKEIIKLLCKGYKTREISDALCISPKTIEKHRANIIKRTRSGTMLESIVYALNRNMIEI